MTKRIQSCRLQHSHLYCL